VYTMHWPLSCDKSATKHFLTAHNAVQWSLGLRCHWLKICCLPSHRVPLFLIAINFRLTICLWYHTAPNFGQSECSYVDSVGLSQSVTPFMSVWSSTGLPFSVWCALPLTCISYIRLTIISVNNGFCGTNYYC
jgi:hypothetical protein